MNIHTFDTLGGPALVPAPDKQENGTLDCPTFNQTDIDVMQTGIDNLMYSGKTQQYYILYFN